MAKCLAIAGEIEGAVASVVDVDAVGVGVVAAAAAAGAAIVDGDEDAMLCSHSAIAWEKNVVDLSACAQK